MVDEAPQILTFDVPKGGVLELTNGSPSAQRYTFRCGVFGNITFVVPIGGSFRWTPGALQPEIIMDDVEDDIDEDENIIRIEKKN